MTQRQISIRIGLDGKADIQRDQQDIADSGDAAFGQLGKAIEQATSAITRQKQAYDNLVDAQAKAKTSSANQNWFNQALGLNNPAATAGGAPTSAQASAFAGMGQQAAALRAQLDPLGAAQAKLNTQVAQYNALAAAGAITEAERVAAVALATKEFGTAESALKGFAAMEGVGSTQSMALFAAIRHMVDATVAGRPPLQSLAMEAGNLSYGLSGSGGVLNAVKAVGSGILSFLISPLGLAATALIVVGGAAVLGFSRAQEAEKQFTDATGFAGRAAGLTHDQFDATAQGAARMSDISVNAARDIEAAFSKTGTVGMQQLGGLIGLTKEFSDKTELSMPEARDALVKAFSDPAKAGEQLLNQLGVLDDKTQQLITTLVSEGRITDAQTVLQNKLNDALKTGTDRTTWYGDAWRGVKDVLSGAIELMAQAHAAAPLALQKAGLENELALAKQGEGLPSADPAMAAKGIESGPRAVSDILADIARVDGAIAKMNADAKQGAADATNTALSKIVGPAIRSAIPDFGTLDALKAQLANASKAGSFNNQGDFVANNTALLAKMGVTSQQAATAQDALTHAVQTYLDPAAKAAKLNQLDIDAINAKTPAQKQLIASQRESVEISGQKITAADAEAKITQAGAKAYAEAQKAVDKHTDALRANLAAQLAVADAYLRGTAAGQMAEEGQQKLDDVIGRAAINGAKQAAQLNDETDARKALNDQIAAGTLTSEQATQQMAIENALSPLKIAYALAEGDAKKELAKVIAALTAARAKDNAEATRTKALTEVEAGNRNIDLLQQELAISNDNDSAREVELAVLQEKQKLLSENTDAESAEGKKLIANAASAAALNQQIDLAKSSRGEIESMFDTLGSQFSNFITQGKYDWKDFASAALSALQDIENEFIKLAVLNPLKNVIFGTNLPDINSVGGVLGSIFGGGVDVPSGALKASSDILDSIIPAAVLHGGGMAGDPANDNRLLSAHLFRNAPRYHDGINPGETAAVLLDNERVLNPAETRAYNAGQRSASGAGSQGMYFDLRGAVVTEDLLKQMNAMANGARTDAVAASSNMLTNYDKGLSKRVAPIAAKVARDARWRG